MPKTEPGKDGKNQQWFRYSIPSQKIFTSKTPRAGDRVDPPGSWTIKLEATKVGSSQNLTDISASQPIMSNHYTNGQQLRKRQKSISPSNVVQTTSRPRYI